jgi:hypothetical protein
MSWAFLGNIAVMTVIYALFTQLLKSEQFFLNFCIYNVLACTGDLRNDVNYRQNQYVPRLGYVYTNLGY